MLDKDLYQIVADASNLYERMNADFLLFEEPTVKEELVIQEKLDEWKKNILQADEIRFNRRIEWDEWNGDKLKKIFTKVKLKENTLLPKWAKILELLIDNITDFSPTLLTLSPIDTETPLPFEDILLPAIYIARQQLFLQLNISTFNDKPLNILSNKAYLNLERALLQKLSVLCDQTLEFEFNKFRPQSNEILGMLLGGGNKTFSRDKYKEFSENIHRNEDWLNFFKTYPVLGRLIATTIEFWVESIVEFIDRLSNDLAEIQDVFFSGKTLSTITDLQASISDPHNRGRSVYEITFDKGIKLVYKPKDLNLQVIYYQFLERLNQLDKSFSFKSVKTLNKNDYGWEEFIEQIPCNDSEEAKRFYERAGNLLCVLYLLNTTDCHFENLIAHGEHLVLIDTETLMNPIIKMLSNSFYLNTVLQIGLLPTWQTQVKENIPFDASGLGCPDVNQGRPYRKTWYAINTDQMYWIDEKPELNLSNHKNLAILNGKYLLAKDYIKNLVSGFENMYQLFLKYKDTSQLHTMLKAFSDCSSRVLCRLTRTFHFILMESVAPKYLHAGIDRSLKLDILSRVLLKENKKPDYWPILIKEIQSLEQMDIPYFDTSSPSIKNILEEHGFNLIIKQLNKFSEFDLMYQIELINGTFYAQSELPHSNSTASITHQSADIIETKLTPAELIQQAKQIGLEVIKHALRDKKNVIQWISPRYNVFAKRLQLEFMSHNIYDGMMGVALFLAALAYITKEEQFSNFAYNILNSARKDLYTNNRLKKELGIGGLTGLGSIIYAFTKISYYLDDKKLLDDAKLAAELITLDDIYSDQHFDIVGGCGGTLLAMLMLYSLTNDKSLMTKSLACGQHLLTRRTFDESGFLAWKNMHARPLTGLAHGAAGIAYSLLKLYEVTKERCYLEAAEMGIAFEQAVFLPSFNNWPDFRFSQQPGNEQCMISWCHGAPGIALARLSGQHILDNDSIQKDIISGLQTTKQNWLDATDYLCCGSFGKLEVLWVAAQKSKDSHLQDTVFNNANLILGKIKSSHRNTSLFSPGFFLGMSGIGYQLLRLSCPEVLPSILTLE